MIHENPPSNPEEYDLFVVLGSGEGAQIRRLDPWPKKGMKTALIEAALYNRRFLSQHNLSPADKNIIHSAKVASNFFRSEDFGISKDNCRINMAAVRERKRKMVAGLVEMHLAQLQGERGG